VWYMDAANLTGGAPYIVGGQQHGLEPRGVTGGALRWSKAQTGEQFGWVWARFVRGRRQSGGLN
jgi:hypothetical protein